MNSLAVKIYQLYTELFESGQQKMNLNKNSYQNCVAPYLIMWFNLPVSLL